MKRKSIILCGYAAPALFLASPAYALLVQPVQINLSTNGLHSSAAITIVNDRNRPDTIEVTVNKLSLPEKGGPVLTPDKGDDFLIFPPTATIAPGKTQVIRIRWVGPRTIPQSQLFMFSTTELPVDRAKGSGVQLVYSIQSVVTVTSPDLKPDLSALSVVRQSRTVPATDEAPAHTERGVAVEFDNSGPALDYVSHYKLRFQTASQSWTKIVEAQEVGKYAGLGLIGGNSKRQIFMAIPDVPPDGDLRLTLEEPTVR